MKRIISLKRIIRFFYLNPVWIVMSVIYLFTCMMMYQYLRDTYPIWCIIMVCVSGIILGIATIAKIFDPVLKHLGNPGKNPRFSTNK